MAYERLWCPSRHKINYVNSKYAFNQEVDYVIQEKRLYCKFVHKRVDIDNIICDIKNKKVDYKAYFIDKCMIVNENGKDILCQVQIIPHGSTINNAVCSFYVVKMKQILSIDDIFDVLYELHIHKPYLEKIEITELVDKCVLHEIFINLFRRSCETCCRIGKNLDLIFKPTIEVSTFSMEPPDGNFSNILMYLEKNTNFVLLRPLSSNFTYVELAYELFTIIIDFGATMYLYSNNMGNVIRDHVLRILKTLDLPLRIPSFVSGNKRNFKSDLLIPKVQTLLSEWMQNTQSSNWAVGISIVQWNLNTNKPLETYTRSKLVKGPLHSPYHATFGLLPCTDIVKIRERGLCEPVESIDKHLVDCSQCNTPIYKVLQCSFCQQPCHFYCCHRYIEKIENVSTLLNLCMSCANNGRSQEEEIILGT